MQHLPLIECNNLTKSYGRKPALINVNLKLYPGKLVGLLGPNASGKTTLIKVINGLLKEYQGSILVNGVVPNADSKAIVSYLPDTTYLAKWMKVKDAISLFKDMYANFDENKALELLTRMKINPNDKIKAMSKGTKEKLQLALVMARNAMIYILDEPIGGVDPAAREFVLDVIENYRDPNSLVILSTHLIRDIEDIFDEIIFLKDGAVVMHDSCEAIKEKEGKTIDEVFREVFRW